MFQMLLTQNILEKSLDPLLDKVSNKMVSMWSDRVLKSWIVVKAYLGDNKELEALVNLMS